MCIFITSVNFGIKTAKPILESFLHCILLAQQQKDDDGFHSCSSSKDLELWDVMKLVKLFAMFNVACQVYDYMTPKYMYIYIYLSYIHIYPNHRYILGKKSPVRDGHDDLHPSCTLFQGLIDAFDAIFLSTWQRSSSKTCQSLLPETFPCRPRSSFIVRRKQEDICGFGVPALNKVGVACVKNFRDIKS